MIIIFLFLFFNLNGCLGHKIVEGDENWGLQMVHNVRWNHSKSYMAVRRERATEQFHEGRMHLGKNVPAGFDDAEMSFFYGMGQPNMMIEFMETADGVPYCKIGVLDVDDNLLASDLLPHLVYDKICSFEKKDFYKYNPARKSKNLRLYGFCELLLKSRWQNATGIYNRPFKTPHCIYDFHKVATVNNEYELLSYCAKGYYYHGMDYIYYLNSNVAKLRKNWLLYLAEGRLQCKISGNVEADERLLSKGYTVELIQYNFRKQCPELSATLTSYHDKRKDGKFFFAAIVGAAQLDGQFVWSYKEPMGFWDEATYKTEYERMNLYERACYLQYHKQLFRDDGRYGLEIKVTHYCSDRGMRTSTSFDVSIGTNQVPDGIYEDTGLVFDLIAEKLRRSTGQTLCPTGRQSDDCEKTEKRLPDQSFFHYFGDGQKCLWSEDCQLGLTCNKQRKEMECGVNPDTGERMCAAKCRPATKSPQKKPDCTKGDTVCREDEFCAFTDDYDDTQECRKARFMEEGEPCCCKNSESINDSRECFPGFFCKFTDGILLGNCTKN